MNPRRVLYNLILSGAKITLNGTDTFSLADAELLSQNTLWYCTLWPANDSAQQRLSFDHLEIVDRSLVSPESETSPAFVIAPMSLAEEEECRFSKWRAKEGEEGRKFVTILKKEALRAFPRDRAGELMLLCALQFKGYESATRDPVGNPSPDDMAGVLDSWMANFKKSFLLSLVEKENWSIFYWLQRHIFKEGARFLTFRDKYQKAAAFLFLHLYNRPVPVSFANHEYTAKWQNISQSDREECAAFVRRWLTNPSAA